MAIIFNEDPNHFIFTRTRGGVKSLTKEDITGFIDQYKGSNITDFLICLNASLPFYPTKRTPSAMDKYRQWKKEGRLADKDDDFIINSVGLLCDAYDRGLPIHQMWIDRLREDGINAWLSIRMNDIHDVDKKDAFLPNELSGGHPELTRAGYRKPASYYEHALDYFHKEVRDYYLTVISEALDTFDCDGIEFDFMREIYSLCIGREYEGTAVMTAFMSDAVALVRDAEKKRGHKISIGTRMPDSPEKALRMGFDILEWVDRGYVDLITVTPRWSSADGDMPIDFWKRILRGKGVRLAAGLEILVDAYGRSGRKYWYNNAETATGFACANSALGADDVYLFNYMDTPWITDPETQSIYYPETYKNFMRTVGDHEKEIASPRRHVVTFSDVTPTSYARRRPLPIALSERDGGIDFTGVRIPTGEIPKGREVRLVIGVERGKGTAGENVKVYVNAKECKCLGACERAYPQYNDMDYFAYQVENDGTLPIVLSAEFGAIKGEARIHWVEAEVR